MPQTRLFLSNLFLTDLETGRLKIKAQDSSAFGKDPAFADKLLPRSSREVQCCVVIQKKSKKGPPRSFHKVTNITRVDSIPVTYSPPQGLHHSNEGSYLQWGNRVGIVKWPRGLPFAVF